jgi:signal transduction histidine kinase
MSFKRLGIAVAAFIVIGMVVFTQILMRQEEKANIRDIQAQGTHMVNSIALHSIQDFAGEKRNFLLRHLMEYSSFQKLAYCFVYNQFGIPVVSLSPGYVESEIPSHISMRSRAAMGFIYQPFKTTGSGHRIYEFAKPILENGKQTGTVRIGLKPPPLSIMPMERISLMAMLSFFIISAIIIVYRGFVGTLKPLEQFSDTILSTADASEAASNNPPKGFGIATMVENLQHSITQFQAMLEKMETNNRELASKIGVLRFEKNQVLNILNSVNMGIIITDMHDNVGHINDYMLNLLNTERPDATDSPLEEILQNDEITSFISEQQELEQPRNNRHLDITFPELAPGETYRISFSYLMDGDKALIGKMILFNHVTREKEAAKTTREFTAHLSHEMLTPLTTIRSYSEMLMEGEIEDTETQKEFYNTINGETSRLTRLIKDLLDLSKIEMGSLTLNKGLVKSDWLFEDSIEAVEGAAQQKNISIQRHLPDNFPALFGDKDKLKVAVINILNNAVKYTPEKGEIHVALREEDSSVVLDIRDTGYGMSEEDRSHIFDKFYRSSNPQIAEQQGTGLGLALASEIIGLHEGEITVQSELGHGTHFMVKIPRGECYLGKQ